MPFRRAAHVGIVGLLLWSLLRAYGSPLLAVPDRGDFYRVGTPAGVVVPEPDLTDPRPRLEYAVRAPALDGLPPSGSLLVLAARAVPGSGEGRLDVRAVSVVYTVVLGAAVGGAIYLGLPPVLGVLLTWASVGPARLSLHASLLSEPAALLALTALTALLAASIPGSGRKAGARAAALVGLAALGGFSRAAASLLPLTLLFALVVSPWRPPLGSVRRSWKLAAILVLGCLPVVHAIRGDAARFRAINIYHAVFRGVAQVSPDPSATLARLGVDASHGARVGSSYFDGAVPRELSASLERVTRWDVAREYLREPRAVARALREITRALSVEWTPGRGAVDRAAFPAWSISRVHDTLFGAFPLLAWGALLLGGSLCLRPRGPARAAALLLLVTFASQLVVTVLGDGLFALGRHLLLARTALQLVVVLALWDAGARLLSRRASRLGLTP